MNQFKMAACGISCEECGLYKITKENDIESAKLLVDWFKGQGWIGKDEGYESILNKNPLCFGCWYITEDCFWKCGCGKRDFRKCCKEKHINHCGECNIFPCEDYFQWTEMHEGHKKAMEILLSLKKSDG